MYRTDTIWGSAAGKIMAALIVLFIVCGVLAASLAYAAYGDVLLTQDEVVVVSSAQNGDKSVTVRLRLDKPGFHLSDIKTEKKGSKLMIELYGSVQRNDAYVMDSTGHYNIELNFDKGIKNIVQEGDDGKEHTLITLNHKQ